MQPAVVVPSGCRPGKGRMTVSMKEQCSAGAHRHRTQRDKELLDLRRPARPCEPERNAVASAGPQHEEELHEAAEEETPRCRIGRVRKPVRERATLSIMHEVLEVRPRRRRPEFLDGVEHRRNLDRDERQDQIGKGDPRKLDRQLKLPRIVGETRRDDVHQRRHEDHCEDQHDELHPHLPGKDNYPRTKNAGRLFSSLLSPTALA